MIKASNDIPVYGMEKDRYGESVWKPNEKELGTLTVSNVTFKSTPDDTTRIAHDLVSIEFETANGTVCTFVDGEELKLAVECTLTANEGQLGSYTRPIPSYNYKR